ncbi:uncharacterized protein LOC132725858 [Ruditapes philippinarum]|uniref:uncharacterized protein LOC132725858 n=1 Tax=Ruditapes philippinarum TaxID=129788 RepID=UPI00295C2DF7|nr:uncharacterized protein LOC132725858 [Ruditapes philippinarum]
MMISLQNSFQAVFMVSFAATIIYSIYNMNPMYTQVSKSSNTTEPIQYTFGSEEIDENIMEFKKSQKNISQVPNLILQYGRPRTATTLQFQIVCLMMAMLHEDEANNVNCFYRTGNRLKYNVIKTHKLMPFLDEIPPDSWIFMTSREADKVKLNGDKQLIKDKNFTVPYIADVRLVSKRSHFIVYEYQRIFGFSDAKMEKIAEYLRYWDVLRVCCGKQMSADWRNKLVPSKYYVPHHDPHSPTYPACEMYNISEVELGMINTHVYMKLSKADSLRRFIGKPEMSNVVLDGTYCSRCNENIAKKKLKFNQNCD